MFSNDNELKKYFYLISYAGIILAIILNLSSVFSFIQYLWQLIIPFIVGFCIAFILNIITNQLEKSLLKNVRNKRKNNRISKKFQCGTKNILFFSQ